MAKAFLLILFVVYFQALILTQSCLDTSIDCRGCFAGSSSYNSLTYDETNKYMYVTGKTSCINGEIFDMKDYTVFSELYRSMLIKYDEFLRPIWIKSIEGFITLPLFVFDPNTI